MYVHINIKYNKPDIKYKKPLYNIILYVINILP